MRKKFKILEVLTIFIFSLTPILWLRNGEVILGHDSGFRLNPLRHLVNLFYSWDPSYNFGWDWSILKGFLVAQAPEAFFTFLTGSISLGQTLTFVFWFFMIGLSMYVFINSFFKEEKYWIFRIFASTFYMYNFFLLQAWFIAERSKFSLMVALPLGLLILYRTFSKEYPIWKGALLFSVLFFLLNGGGNPTMYGFITLAYVITILYLTIFDVRKDAIKGILFSSKVVLIFLVSFIGINGYWLFPQIALYINSYASIDASLGGSGGSLAWEATISKCASFINLFRLQGIPDWYNNDFHPYANDFIKNPFLIFLSYIPFTIILIGLIIEGYGKIDRSRFRILTLLFILFLTSFVFVSGSRSPLGFIYTAFMQYIPGFTIFRSSFYKFGGLFWFSFIFIAGFYLNLLSLRFLKKRIIYTILGIFSVGFILLYHYPFFLTNFFAWKQPFSTKLKVPQYIHQMSDYINAQNQYTRILLLPKLDDDFRADSYRWGYFSLDSFPRLFTNKSIVANTLEHPEIINSLYFSISQKDENAFLRLTGIAGITKLLWRDDILYPDNTTTGKDFISVKKNLENFKSIKLEKKIEAWSLYQIESPYYAPIFYSADTIVYAQSDLSKLQSIFNEVEDSRNLAILFDESMKDKNRDILLFSNKNVIETKCILCTEGFNAMGGGISMPAIRILPNSPFYYILSLREQQVQRAHTNNPLLRIDADLGYANKRIVEMKEIANAKMKDENPRLFVIQAIKRYKTLMMDAVEQTSLLPEDKKNEAFIKILSYLNSQFQFLSVQQNLYNYALEDFEELSIFMQERIEYLGSNIWATNMAENKIKYFLNIDKSGTYDLHVTTADIQTRTVTVDRRNLTELKNIYLTKGIHKLQISHPVIENLIDVNQATESGELYLPFSKRIKFRVKNFNPKETYFVNFNYKISHGRPNASIVETEKSKQHARNLLLNQNKIWNSFSSVFKPSRYTESVSLEFFPTGFETTEAIIEVKNLKIVKVSVPEVLLSRSVSAPITAESPKMSFYEANPTMYKIEIESSSSPYLLAFGESYNNGWRAYIVEDNKKDGFLKDIIRDFFQTFFIQPIPETHHYILNGYANGWLVDKKGHYAIIVEYFPQKIFYAGLFVSGASFFIIALIWLKRRGKL